MSPGHTFVIYLLAVIAITILVLAILAANKAYRNGFHDGAMWMKHGDTYPSKPPSSWYGWKSLRRRRGES